MLVVDDGRGMQRRDLARYHDVAASTKQRGDGIGFAGVGIKLGLLVSSEVVTETRRGASHVATRWHLASRYRAPWKWIPPPGLVTARGTAVQLRLTNPLSPLLDAGYLEEALRRHFEPLFDAAFDEILRRHYGRGLRFEVDGRMLVPERAAARDRVAIPIRMGRRRIPSAVAVLERHDLPLPEERRGIAISTFGKVIRRGWDWLGLTPADPARVSGLIEAPDLAACLTLSKNDFIRTGTRGATYLSLSPRQPGAGVTATDGVGRQPRHGCPAPHGPPGARSRARARRFGRRVPAVAFAGRSPRRRTEALAAAWPRAEIESPAPCSRAYRPPLTRARTRTVSMGVRRRARSQAARGSQPVRRRRRRHRRVRGPVIRARARINHRRQSVKSRPSRAAAGRRGMG